MRSPSALKPLLAATASVTAALLVLTAGSPRPDRGKEVFDTVCSTCHTLTPPPAKAPPMLMIAGHYVQESASEAEAMAAMRAWVPAPDTARSLLPAHAVERFGVMAPLGLPDEDIEAVVGYVFSEWKGADRPGPRAEGESCGRCGMTGKGMRHGTAMEPGRGMQRRLGMTTGLNQESDGATILPPTEGCPCGHSGRCPRR